MKFKVEAYLDILGDERYRLQQDGEWRLVGRGLTRNVNEWDPHDDSQPTDKLFETLEDTKAIVCQKGELYFGDRMCRVNPSSIAFGEENIAELKPKVYRETKPRQFGREELRSVIAKGDNSCINALVLDLEGYFQLVYFFDAGRKLAPYAVRHEAFAPFRGYVGRKAAADGQFIRETYFTMLENWITHLYNNELDNFADYPVRHKSEEELWKEVEMLTKHLK